MRTRTDPSRSPSGARTSLAPRRALLGLAVWAATLGRAQGQGTGASRARDDLLRAVRRNDPSAIRTALLRGADANSLDEFGAPVIVSAAKERDWEAMRALAELRGTNLDAVDKEGSNAMMYAALHGRLDLVRFLVDRAAEVNKTGWTALHFAAANGHVEVMRYLLEQHAYIDAESPNGTTPLMMATRQGHVTAVEVLVAEGADPTPRNAAGLDAAAYARATDNPRLARWLTDRAAEFRRKYGTPAPRP